MGIDINPKFKAIEYINITICIGSQSNISFLRNIVGKFKVPDIVLDGGIHEMDDITETFDFLFPKMRPNSIYIAEVLYTADWGQLGRGINNPSSFINKAKGLID